MPDLLPNSVWLCNLAALIRSVWVFVCIIRFPIGGWGFSSLKVSQLSLRGSVCILKIRRRVSSYSDTWIDVNEHFAILALELPPLRLLPWLHNLDWVMPMRVCVTLWSPATCAGSLGCFLSYFYSMHSGHQILALCWSRKHDHFHHDHSSSSGTLHCTIWCLDQANKNGSQRKIHTPSWGCQYFSFPLLNFRFFKSGLAFLTDGASTSSMSSSDDTTTRLFLPW